jgi:hypothetical protein
VSRQSAIDVLLALAVGETTVINGAMVRYDGRYDWIPAPDDRQYTVLNHWIDADGADRFKGSFSLCALTEIGLISK